MISRICVIPKIKDSKFIITDSNPARNAFSIADAGGNKKAVEINVKKLHTLYHSFSEKMK